FEGCLPLEELARRGRDTLRFGPMKPVGLADPRTGQMAWAVVQLRQENLLADAYNLVGFQTHLRYPEQKRVFRLIPGLEQAEILRYGQVHRNTYLNSPAILRDTLQARRDPRLFFAGQISGVEGYVECVATGLICGINAVRLATGQEPVVFARVTACGSLVHYIAHSDLRDFQPTNINFAMLPPLEDGARRRLPSKRERHREQIRLGLAEIDALQTQLQAASAANFRA
ncbi:MAG: methylenetetrahydrofolate--tRNA-(uracil(54)-C(5))-methyltransferase (FADH(2)-oxidizing) TrmFO, partial [Acidobacteria bacterium]|nr:methylenetetrahydrofolate--tRNA-(uracil(54)-C(5))-methyltransferase (FADH(2)-oxidizing) TrmFO [Acidobacteriota bacterium]